MIWQGRGVSKIIARKIKVEVEDTSMFEVQRLTEAVLHNPRRMISLEHPRPVLIYFERWDLLQVDQFERTNSRFDNCACFRPRQMESLSPLSRGWRCSMAKRGREQLWVVEPTHILRIHEWIEWMGISHDGGFLRYRKRLEGPVFVFPCSTSAVGRESHNQGTAYEQLRRRAAG